MATSRLFSLIFCAGVVLLSFRQVATEEIQYGGKCLPSNTCIDKNSTCRNGSCSCSEGFYYCWWNWPPQCVEYTKIQRIVTMEDHPWVIVNRTCLKSPDITALSCRHTTCYTGLLIDLLHVIDTQYSNMDNCTILGIETFGKPTNAGRSLTKNDTADVVGRGEADLALVTPGNGNTTNYKKFQPDAAFYALSLGFPKGSEFPDGYNFLFNL
ncbi:hypothetical protein Fcan01_17319 [Folsomia candida]|uniref:EB domain-containing protein n=1 Tax=Folsomia candida TaxID=158441 RepID=A0A226DRZ5_FOLCA|nr:hypothetical protein Fcan01_17319 [Folsomia candida]